MREGFERAPLFLMSYQNFIKWNLNIPITYTTPPEKPSHRYRNKTHFSFDLVTTNPQYIGSLASFIEQTTEQNVTYVDFQNWANEHDFLTFEFSVKWEITDIQLYEQAHGVNRSTSISESEYAGSNAGDICVGLKGFAPNNQVIAYESGYDDRYIYNDGMVFCGPSSSRHVLILRSPFEGQTGNFGSPWPMLPQLEVFYLQPSMRYNTIRTAGLSFHLNVTVTGGNIQSDEIDSVAKHTNGNSDHYEVSHTLNSNEPWSPYYNEVEPNPPLTDLKLGSFEVLTGRNVGYDTFASRATNTNNTHNLFIRRAAEYQSFFMYTQSPRDVQSTETTPSLYVPDASEDVVNVFTYLVRKQEVATVETHLFVSAEYPSTNGGYGGFNGTLGESVVNLSEFDNTLTELPNSFAYFTKPSGVTLGSPTTYYTCSEYISSDNIKVHERLNITSSFIEIDVNAAIDSVIQSGKIMSGGEPMFFTIVSVPQKNAATDGVAYRHQGFFSAFGIYGFNVNSDREIVSFYEDAMRWRQPGGRSDCTIWSNSKALQLNELSSDLDIGQEFRFGLYVYGDRQNASNQWLYNNSLTKNPRFIINCWYKR